MIENFIDRIFSDPLLLIVAAVITVIAIIFLIKKYGMTTAFGHFDNPMTKPHQSLNGMSITGQGAFSRIVIPT